MAYWLLKSEPETWSWEQQIKRGEKGEPWSGVRNYQARLNLRAMKKGERGFFYHSGEEKAIVGIVEIIRCIQCIRDGAWPSRERDVEEVDVDKLKAMVHVKDEDLYGLDKYVAPPDRLSKGGTP